MYTISVRVDEDKAKLLDTLCHGLNRSRNYLVNQAIDRYLQQEAIFLKELMESIEEADEGKLIEHGAVMADIDDLIKMHS